MARTGLGLSVLLSLSLFGAVIWLSTAYTALVRDLPSIEYIPALLEPPGGMLLHPTRLYDRSGSHLISALENPAAEGREYLYVPANWTKSSLLTTRRVPSPSLRRLQKHWSTRRWRLSTRTFGTTPVSSSARWVEVNRSRSPSAWRTACCCGMSQRRQGGACASGSWLSS
jgi:hypothetical protein